MTTNRKRGLSPAAWDVWMEMSRNDRGTAYVMDYIASELMAAGVAQLIWDDHYGHRIVKLINRARVAVKREVEDESIG